MTYTVQPGDTLFRIAQRFGVTLAALLRANPQIADPNRIFPGQVINIPGTGTPPPPAAVTYTVRPGDTMYLIARRFDVDLGALIRANPQIADPRQIQPGQVINIPADPPAPPATGIVRTNIPYGYQELQTDLAALRQRYPFLRFGSAGQSVLGRDLTTVTLGAGPKVVVYAGAHHANEWITSALLAKFIEEYARAYETGGSVAGFNARQIYDSTRIVVLPMVNPDGVELVIRGIAPSNPYYSRVIEWNGGSTDFHLWKANIRGVDLNRQYRANWDFAQREGAQGPSPSSYAGPAPESEPESRAVADLTRTLLPRLVLAYHSQGEIIYWNYLGLAPAESRTIVTRFQQLSGYVPVEEPPESAGSAGYKDWFILAYRRPGFTVEVGRGLNPLPLSQLPEIIRDNLGLLMYAATA